MKRKKKKSCAKGGKLQPENLHQTLKEILDFLYFIKLLFQAFGKWMETFNYDFSIHKTAKVIGIWQTII